MDTDANSFSIGYVLSQVQEEKERGIAQGSRVQSKQEQNYCVTSREM